MSVRTTTTRVARARVRGHLRSLTLLIVEASKQNVMRAKFKRCRRLLSIFNDCRLSSASSSSSSRRRLRRRRRRHRRFRDHVCARARGRNVGAGDSRSTSNKRDIKKNIGAHL